MFITPDQNNLLYSGRIDFSDPQCPEVVYAGSYIKICFTGRTIKVKISNHRSYFNSYLGFILDGKQDKIQLENDSEIHEYKIADKLGDGKHELMLFKRMDSCHTFSFHGFEIDGEAELFPCEPLPARRMEVFGDSVSCGEVSEAIGYLGQSDPKHNGEFSNSWYSYSWLAARLLNAEVHITSQGGAALLNETGWFHGPHFVGMESIYDKIQYNDELGSTKEWDFSLWQPQLVVLAFGQNDANPVDIMEKEYEGEAAEHWRREYRAFIEKIQALYPGVTIICTTTILGHHPNWDKAIDQVCREMNHPKVHHFLYTKNGCGTSGHIRIPEAKKMAEELAAYVNSLGDIWNV